MLLSSTGDYGMRAVNKSDFLNENTIIGASQTFIQVDFFVFEPATNSQFKPNGPVAVNFYDEGSKKIILRKNYIQNAEFSGVEIGARRGKINIVDPEGLWVDAMNVIGEWKNHISNIGKANMIIRFGWIGLSGNNPSNIQEIAAVMLKTAFTISDNGSVNIEINFIENCENLLNVIKFNKFEDMVFLNTHSSKDNIKEFTIKQILDYICYRSESIKQQLSAFGLCLEFEETHEDSGQRYGETGADLKIRLGDTLGSKINELISRAQQQKDLDTVGGIEVTWSYEMDKMAVLEERINIGDTMPQGKGSIKYETGWQYKIKFRWKSAPRNGGDDLTSIQQRSVMGFSGSPVVSGPILQWKKQSIESNTKQLISFDVDLKMLDYAASMIRSELDRRLSNMKDQNWDDIAPELEKLNDPAILLMSPQDLSYEMKKNINDPTRKTKFTGINYKGGIGNTGIGWNSDEQNRIKGSSEEFNKILANSSLNATDKINTIISNNVFKAKAKIMGDPTIGTKNLVFRFTFTTDFSGVSEFASFFSREWLMSGSVHRIDESGYFTEIDLMALPPGQQKPPSLAESNRVK